MIYDLEKQWIELKDAEKEIISKRRQIEDKIIAMMNVGPDFEGSKKGEKIRVSFSTTKSVDVDVLKEISRQKDVKEQVKRLFSWSAKINLREWKSTEDSIKNMFVEAITTKQSRPSFELLEKKEC